MAQTQQRIYTNANDGIDDDDDDEDSDHGADTGAGGQCE